MGVDSMDKRTRIKFCGFTREEDVQAAVRGGVDALGLVFFAKSKRAVSLAQAARLRKEVPTFVKVVALFVNPDPAYVQEVIDTVSPDMLQFHGDESPQECEGYCRPYMKAFRVGGPGMDTRQDVMVECRRFLSADAWLFDSYSAAYGGSGQGFELSLLGDVLNAADARPLVLAGGLSAENVGENIRKLRPFAVDVSSGIEDAPGAKSVEKMAAFFEAVRSADTQIR